MAESPYNKFSDFLLDRYGCRVYKVPVSIPCSCPNRDGTKGTGGCIFCGEEAAGFESYGSDMPVTEQISNNMDYMGKKYKAEKFIAYFQNYSNTYLDFNLFKKYIKEACMENIAALYISTRPDCIFEEHAEFLKKTQLAAGVDVVVEMGLQSTDDRTLEFLNRQHTADDFFKSAEMLGHYGISTCAHMINDIPIESAGQVTENARRLSGAGIAQVKCHSLYVLKNTVLGDMYESGEIEMLECADFIERTILFLKNLSKEIIVQRLMGRAPESRTLFCNYGRSWRAVVDEIENIMIENGWRQGDAAS